MQSATSQIKNSAIQSQRGQGKQVEQAVDKVTKAATLPSYTRAAAAQRLNDLPEKPERGVYYDVPHRRPNPTGWRTKRHIKRKLLSHSNKRYAAL